MTMTMTTTRLLALALVTFLVGSAAARDGSVRVVEDDAGSTTSIHRIVQAHEVGQARAALLRDFDSEDSSQGEIDPDWLAWTAAMDECLETGLTEEECIDIVSPIVFAVCLANARSKKNACLDQVQEDYEDGIIGSTYAGEVACELRYDADIMDCMNLL